MITIRRTNTHTYIYICMKYENNKVIILACNNNGIKTKNERILKRKRRSLIFAPNIYALRC